jgi:hypothetical protein
MRARREATVPPEAVKETIPADAYWTNVPSFACFTNRPIGPGRAAS